MGPPQPPHPAVPGRPCSAAAALQIVGERWSLLAIRELFYGNHRFDQLTRNTGAPRDRLAARLRALEEAGVVERRRYSERPERFEYHLTAAGRELAPVVWSLVKWGDKWAVDSQPVAFSHEAARHPEHEVDTVTLCRTCGEQVVSGEVEITMLAPGWDRAGTVSDS
ncbi:MAG: helix-turn-helix transcriptional regulator [Catenulispora sp.]|nr:helix-turn-helix transcriptional regulator [Catenulispora sp.]